MLMSAAVAADILGSVVGALNTEAGAGAVLQAWDGSIPPDLSTGDSGTKVAECACSNPVFATAIGNVSSANAISDDTSTVAGTVAYWRLRTSGGGVILQWEEGVDFVTDNPTFNNGDTCHIVGIDITITVTPPDS